jgi:hypothetical protein
LIPGTICWEFDQTREDSQDAPAVMLCEPCCHVSEFSML